MLVSSRMLGEVIDERISAGWNEDIPSLLLDCQETAFRNINLGKHPTFSTVSDARLEFQMRGRHILNTWVNAMSAITAKSVRKSTAEDDLSRS